MTRTGRWRPPDPRVQRATARLERRHRELRKAKRERRVWDRYRSRLAASGTGSD